MHLTTGPCLLCKHFKICWTGSQFFSPDSSTIAPSTLLPDLEKFLGSSSNISWQKIIIISFPLSLQPSWARYFLR